MKTFEDFLNESTETSLEINAQLEILKSLDHIPCYTGRILKGGFAEQISAVDFKKVKETISALKKKRLRHLFNRDDNFRKINAQIRILSTFKPIKIFLTDDLNSESSKGVRYADILNAISNCKNSLKNR